MDRSSELADNLAKVESEITTTLNRIGRPRDAVTLVVVTKNFPVGDIDILYQCGIRDFGENREQEAREKVNHFAALAASGRNYSDIRWHFQGQLQRNKLASIGSWAHLVHSIDDVKYLKGLSDSALSHKRIVEGLIQISLDPHPAAGRGGVNLEGAEEIISTYESKREELAGLNLVGVMGVAPLGESAAEAFTELQSVFSQLRRNTPYLSTLSAGMSGDYISALEHGATHIRIGSSILGNRSPHE